MSGSRLISPTLSINDIHHQQRRPFKSLTGYNPLYESADNLLPSRPAKSGSQRKIIARSANIIRLSCNQQYSYQGKYFSLINLLQMNLRLETLNVDDVECRQSFCCHGSLLHKLEQIQAVGCITRLPRNSTSNRTVISIQMMYLFTNILPHYKLSQVG